MFLHEMDITKKIRRESWLDYLWCQGDGKYWAWQNNDNGWVLNPDDIIAGDWAYFVDGSILLSN
ncbi:hypothetical protein DRH14_03620 [Candidatus Shapirobacteria bacterium]|nr:MAG: hypothetical protein DRH14_03620 [Candidatus Shapirobacteria bacterium]RLG44006.1 MAG: hypothetical protein DRN81_05450 [Candidatus Korarchaeota archaeon]